MKGGNLGSSRDCQDRFIQGQDSTVVNVFQQKYWKTKQTLVKVPGNKEDEYVVVSDADLDNKLEVFHSIQRTCMDLLRVTEQYQKRIYFLSQEEKELGHFLRTQDKSRAGKIMQATGKALCFCSQQRLALRKPLCHLYQEVETFRYRSISDTWLTVNRMEQSRTRYQGALLWMKDVSQELDPDIHKQMEQFRKVQAQVRTTKTSFDKLKNDVCQKVDLLGVNRCNLLSHVLTTYQTTLLHFWEKMSHTMAAIHESFRGCQQYEFSTLKNLQDTMDKVAKKKIKKQEEDRIKMETADEQLISLINESTTDKTRGEAEEDNMASLKEILGTLSLDTETGTTAASDRPAEAQQKEDPLFLPSQLLDHSVNNPQFSLSDWTGFMESLSGTNQNPVEAAAKETTDSSKDLSAWFNPFASLDPLSDPDVVGKTDAERELHNA